MTKNDIIRIISEYGYKTSYLKFFRNIEYLQWWEEKVPPTSVNEVFYNIYHHNTVPYCINHNKLLFINFNKGYSNVCHVKDCECRNIAKKNAIKKRVDNIGADGYANIRKKANQTNLLRYGSENVFSSSMIKDKIKSTVKEKYNVDYYSQTDEYKDKIKDISMAKYGVDHFTNNPEVINKRKKTSLLKYGNEHHISSDSVREKSKVTMFDRYGVDNIFKNNEYISDIIFQKYGVSNVGRLHLSKSTIALIDNEEAFKLFCENKSFETVAKELGISSTQISKIADKRQIRDIFSLNVGSSYEDEISNWLSGINLERNNRRVIKPKELDFFIEESNVGIEVDGLYYHSEFSGKKSRNYHLNKQNECREKNIRLFQVYSDEWDNKKELCKSIIGSALGIYVKTRIFARNCVVKNITWKECADFIENNHLQGKGSPTKYNMGLYYGDELVSVMTFSKNRKSINRSGWELTRLCTRYDLNIIGGPEKLLKHSINYFKIQNELLSYCDRRWFTGSTYKKLGFKHNGVTQSGYYYTDYSNRFQRYSFQKSKLVKQGFDSTKSELDIMRERGYDRIWNSGNDIFILNL